MIFDAMLRRHDDADAADVIFADIDMFTPLRRLSAFVFFFFTALFSFDFRLRDTPPRLSMLYAITLITLRLMYICYAISA